MDIIYDHQCFQAQSRGGISRYFVELANGLAAIGENVTVFVGLTRRRGLRTELNKNVKVIGGFPLVARFPRSARFADRFNRAWFSGWTRRRSGGIYHPTYYRMQPGPKGAKQVVTVFDFIHERFPEVAVNDPGVIEMKRNAIGDTDAAICISQATLHDLLRFNPGTRTTVHLVHLGCRMKPARPLQSAQPYVLYVGARGLYKNFEVLAAAFAGSKLLKDRYQLRCVGGELDLGEAPAGVRWCRVDADDEMLAALYSGAVALVYCSRCEGFGLPLLEAMNCGCPVVTTRCGSIPEIAGAAAVYFDPDSPEELGSTILRVANDAKLRVGLVAAGYDRAAEFTWARCADETLKVYQRVLAAGAS